jgi:hypothetical protein
MQTKHLKIGVTINVGDNGKVDFWSNGLVQNIIMIAKLLKQSKKNYKVTLLNTNGNSAKVEMPFDLKEYPIKPYHEHAKKMDLIIYLGCVVPDSDVQALKDKNPNFRSVVYLGGNNYVMEMERIMFQGGGEEFTPLHNTVCDEIWMVPQQENQNKGYLSVMHRTPAIAVPFVWDKMFVEKEADLIDASHQTGTGFKEPSYHVPSDKPKRLSVFEPNINVVKWSMIPISITELFYRKDDKNKKSIEFLSVTNASGVAKTPAYASLIGKLDLHKDTKLFIETRYAMPFFLSQHTDIVVSHQWENPLNYAYLDALYLGYPLVHNAWMIKDAGYYYNGFDVEDGVKQLTKAIYKHNQDDYDTRSEKVLMRYSSETPELIEQYDKLIDNLFNNPGANFKTKYDYKTNSLNL